MKKLLVGLTILASTSSYALEQQAVGDYLLIGGTVINCPLLYNGNSASTKFDVSSERFQFFDEKYNVTDTHDSSTINYSTKKLNSSVSAFVNEDGILDYQSNEEEKSIKIPVLRERVSLSQDSVKYVLNVESKNEVISITLNRRSISKFRTDDVGYGLFNPDFMFTNFNTKIKASVEHSDGQKYDVHCTYREWR